MLDIAEMTRENVRRCESAWGFNHPLKAWSVLEWAGAAAGKAGEAAHVAKKMSRFNRGFSVASRAHTGKSRDELKRDLARKMADTFIYHVLLAAREGLDIEAAIRDTYNAKSVEIGWPGRI